MDRLAFAPSANEFFLFHDGAAGEDLARREGLVGDLARVGWPAPAHLLGPDGARRQADGVVIELIDALPLLAAETDADTPTLLPWREVARLGLHLVQEGRLVPMIRARYDNRHDPRPSGWEARWIVVPGEAERAHLPALADWLGPPWLALPVGRVVHAGQLEAPRPPGAMALLRRVLCAVADTLVREASWRGAVVRLGGWPADAWEQRLLRALSGVHPRFGGPDAEGHAAEVNAWSRDQGAGPSLLPSPPSWQAPEDLHHAIGRLLSPAALLAAHLLAHPAPRSLTAPAPGS